MSDLRVQLGFIPSSLSLQRYPLRQGSERMCWDSSHHKLTLVVLVTSHRHVFKMFIKMFSLSVERLNSAETEHLQIAHKRSCVCFGRDPVWCNTTEIVKGVVNEKGGSWCLFLIVCVSLIPVALIALLHGSSDLGFFGLVFGTTSADGSPLRAHSGDSVSYS